MEQLLLLGGTGFVGRSVCEALARADASLRIVVPSRRPEQAKRLTALPALRLVRADVHDEAQLAGLLDGCDAVVNLVAILHGSATAFERTHVELPRKLASACHARGVTRLVHVSAPVPMRTGRAVICARKAAVKPCCTKRRSRSACCGRR